MIDSKLMTPPTMKKYLMIVNTGLTIHPMHNDRTEDIIHMDVVSQSISMMSKQTCISCTVISSKKAISCIWFHWHWSESSPTLLVYHCILHKPPYPCKDSPIHFYSLPSQTIKLGLIKMWQKNLIQDFQRVYFTFVSNSKKIAFSWK